MSEVSERLRVAIAYLEADAAGDTKGKWAKGYRQACADHVAVLRLVLGEDEGPSSKAQVLDLALKRDQIRKVGLLP